MYMIDYTYYMYMIDYMYMHIYYMCMYIYTSMYIITAWGSKRAATARLLTYSCTAGSTYTRAITHIVCPHQVAVVL